MIVYNRSISRAKIVPTIESLENDFRNDGRMSLLDQKYVEAVLRGVQDKENGIDYVYGVYLHKDGLIFGNKRFDVNDADNIITDIVRYIDTSALYVDIS